MPTPSAALPLPLEPIFTIGHSTRSYGEFFALLQESGVQCVVDVRKLTGSRRYPQFNADALAAALAADGIGYVHIAQLGGRRGRTLPAGTPSPNGFWTNDSFRRYADYALGSDFDQGLQELLQRSAHQRCAVMCAEAVWWRCHRRIIADYLLLHGRAVQHILGPGQRQTAQPTAGAVRLAHPKGTPTDAVHPHWVYPAQASP